MKRILFNNIIDNNYQQSNKTVKMNTEQMNKMLSNMSSEQFIALVKAGKEQGKMIKNKPQKEQVDWQYVKAKIMNDMDQEITKLNEQLQHFEEIQDDNEIEAHVKGDPRYKKYLPKTNDGGVRTEMNRKDYPKLLPHRLKLRATSKSGKNFDVIFSKKSQTFWGMDGTEYKTLQNANHVFCGEEYANKRLGNAWEDFKALNILTNKKKSIRTLADDNWLETENYTGKGGQYIDVSGEIIYAQPSSFDSTDEEVSVAEEFRQGLYEPDYEPDEDQEGEEEGKVCKKCGEFNLWKKYSFQIDGKEVMTDKCADCCEEEEDKVVVAFYKQKKDEIMKKKKKKYLTYSDFVVC